MKTYLVFIKHIFAVSLGAIFFHFYIAKYKPYYAAQRVYDILQSNSNTVIKKSLLAYITNDYQVKKKQVRDDYRFYLKHKDKDQLSKRVVDQYSDDSLKGYGDLIYDKGGKTYEEQQRGLILPTLYKAIEEVGSAKTICEIGTANGDIISYVAEKYPENNFLGVDFSVKTAEFKHHNTKNLEFIKGYPLELIEENKLKFDLAFFSSTLLVFNPKELSRYLKAMKSVGCTDIVINEPFWSFYEMDAQKGEYSKHLEQAVWFHNYTGYLEKAGYKVKNIEIIENYKHPKSKREDIKVVLCHASLNS